MNSLTFISYACVQQSVRDRLLYGTENHFVSVVEKLLAWLDCITEPRQVFFQYILSSQTLVAFLQLLKADCDKILLDAMPANQRI